MLTYTVLALPWLSATISAARLWPILALLPVPATLARIPLPGVAVLQQVTKATPFCWASAICLETAARLTALRITASAPWRSAVSNAFCSCSGEPSVLIVDPFQPRSAAPCLMMSPWISQACTPQLMNTTFLPVGTGLPTAVASPIVVGRVVACWASDCARATPALSPLFDGDPEVELPALEPHAVAVAIAAPSNSSAAPL